MSPAPLLVLVAAAVATPAHSAENGHCPIGFLKPSTSAAKLREGKLTVLKECRAGAPKLAVELEGLQPALCSEETTCATVWDVAGTCNELRLQHTQRSPESVWVPKSTVAERFLPADKLVRRATMLKVRRGLVRTAPALTAESVAILKQPLGSKGAGDAVAAIRVLATTMVEGRLWAHVVLTGIAWDVATDGCPGEGKAVADGWVPAFDPTTCEPNLALYCD